MLFVDQDFLTAILLKLWNEKFFVIGLSCVMVG